MSFIILSVILILAWGYNLCNGMNDAANAIATPIATRALSPFWAIIIARTMNFVGALVSVEVAKTIGKGIVYTQFINSEVVVAALIGSVAWGFFCTYLGLPISLTHALVAGIMGGGVAAVGWHSINWQNFNTKILQGLWLSPVSGFIIAAISLILLLWVFRRMTPSRANKFFRSCQIFSCSYMSFAHGMNDAQNGMGIIAAGLLAVGFIPTFEVPLWVKITSAFFIALGTSVGGWRVIRTLSVRLSKLQPVQGFSAEVGAATTMLVASLAGAPISTTHAITAAIMGAGTAKRLSLVRWGVAGHIVAAWVVTFPGAGLTAYLSYILLNRLF